MMNGINGINKQSRSSITLIDDLQCIMLRNRIAVCFLVREYINNINGNTFEIFFFFFSYG